VSDGSKIEWTQSSWNPVLGCDRVSPGCDLCYAISQARIREANPDLTVAAAFAGLTDRIDGRLDWTGRVNLLPERLEQPLHWRKPRRVFVNSLADLFHKSVPDEFIAQVFAVMASAQRHAFQLLTKRHARMRSLLSSPAFQSAVSAATAGLSRRGLPDFRVLDVWPLPNVWLGVSVEDRHWAGIRIPALLDTPAAVRWVSAEPLLGPLRLPFLEEYDACTCGAGPGGYYGMHERGCGTEPGPAWGRLHWIVAGGESGPGARPMHPSWPRALRDQCQEAGVPFFFKQWGEWAPNGLGYGVFSDPRDRLVGDAVDDRGFRVLMRRTGKKAAGRLLDGRTWDEFPRTAEAVTAS
jgi:protein gp37